MRLLWVEVTGSFVGCWSVLTFALMAGGLVGPPLVEQVRLAALDIIGLAESLMPRQIIKAKCMAVIVDGLVVDAESNRY